MQAAGYRPAAEVARAGRAPVVGGKPRAGFPDFKRHLPDGLGFHAAFLFGKLRRVVCVGGAHFFDETFKNHGRAGEFRFEPLLPVHPVFEVIAVVQALVEDDFGHSQQHGGLRAGVGGQPVVGQAGGVGQARVHDHEFGAVHFAFDDALGVRIEIVPRLEVRRDEQDDSGVGMVG